MSKSGYDSDTEEQMAGSQHEVQDLQRELHSVADSSCLKETTEVVEEGQSHLQGKLDDPPGGPRRSERARNPTEKMRALQAEEAKKMEKGLLSMYEQWKLKIRKARDQLKSYMPDDELWPLVEELRKSKEDIMNIYSEMRDLATPSTDIRRRVDTCESVTTEIIIIAHNRAIDDEVEFNEKQERHRLHELLHRDYAKSVYGSAASLTSHSKSDHHSMTSSMAAKRADAAAELAVKETNYEMMIAEERQREVIRELEEQQRIALEAQRYELERLQAEKEVRAAKAKLNVYNKETEHKAADCINIEKDKEATNVPVTAVSPSHVATPSHKDISSLAQVFQDSIALNRLPVPEPFVFNGDPIRFTEWKASFSSLIDQRAITPAEKLYYLKKYVAGPARQVLDGTFFRNDDEAYQDAWNKLTRRFGQPFAIQRAFREKLTNWPRIQPKDAEGLRNFSDFLNACQDAMPHVKGLDILNDCEENQKLVYKLPDWAASRWNRQATRSLNDRQEFPSFKDFAIFVSTEAEIACNPITSLYALRSSDSNAEKRNLRDTKTNQASVYTTQAATDIFNKGSEQRKTCILCQDNRHQLHACPKFTEMLLVERRNYVKEKKLCYGCLKFGHSAKSCRHRHCCDNCKGKHPTALHDYNYGKEKSSSEAATNQRAAATSLSVAGEGSSYTSMVMPVWVSSKNNPTAERLVYALLDTQSDTTFIDQEVSDSLNADKYPVKLKLTTMSGMNTVLSSESVFGLCVRGYSSAIQFDLPVAYSKDCIPVNRAHIPTCETAKQWSHLREIAEEIQPLKDCEIGLLIGYNCSRAMAPRQVILGGDEEPYAVRTDLGWSIVGRSSQSYDPPSSSRLCHKISIKVLPPVTPADAIRILESDFKDDSEDSKTVSQDDITFLNKLNEGIQKNKHGHYQMPLPFKKRPSMPDNKNSVMIRLNHLKRKLQRDEKYKEQYVKFMEEIIERGDAEQIEDGGSEVERWYIPHHGVRHAKKPDKLRVVFDCSARHKGTSLNDHLLSGPDLLNNLSGVLIRFRRYPVALMCDIEKMFHQFHVDEADRNYLRFLWWKQGDLNSPPSEFRMKVHLFGAASSPGCANFGMKHLAKENGDLYPKGSQFIMRDFYVDDGLTSAGSTEEAVQLAREARELCAMGGLRLHKFVSNERNVLESIPPSERAINVTNMDLTFDELPLERALGIQWDVESDHFRLSVSLKDQPATRRGILSTVASLYDPLGFVAPVLLKAKIILQEMCRRGTGWDDPLPDELRPKWEKWRDDLAQLDNVTIPRTYSPAGFGKVLKTQLHHFSDASLKGYGQCSYLRLQNEEGDVHCALVVGKSRVSPSKVTTVPRLELTAAVVSVKMSNMLKEEFGSADTEEVFWTDSKVVLGYIKNEARRFHTFVANRVQKIHLSSDPQQWRYVPTNENPADHASRSLTPSELLSSTWFTGPKFLWHKEMKPPADEIPELIIGDPEVRSALVLNTRTTEQASLVDRLSKFSSWSLAIRAVARLLRRIRKNRSNNLTTVTEREDAEHCIIKDLQKNVYQEELKLLSKGVPLPSHNSLHSLDAFLDKDGVFRVGGRLCNSSLPNSIKHPAIIPKDHHITKMIIAHHHERIEHQGKGLTLNEIRSHGYWIPGINRAVASHIRQCVTCRRHRKPTEEQRMADLPPERVEPSPPFTFCGMDCFGPFLTKQGRKENKRYGLLFTCFSSRAIHIEMLDGMSTDALINGLRCFIAMRGAVRQIKSDQGSNFVGAKNELKEALKEVDADRLAVFLAEKQCDFCMNAPYSSHVGGVWERQIRTVRSVLRSTLALSSGRLNDASLRAFLYEAMAIVNSRPLTVDNLSDPHSLEPLTPNHLLTMKTVRALPPPGEFVREDMYGKKRWRHVQYLAEQFWSRWRKEYLANISLRQRWHAPKRNLQVGDIVMMKGEDAHRNEWRLGRVLETTIDKDGLVRRVKICLGDRNLGKKGERLHKMSEVERPVQRLVLLLETN
ncbi:uncharacterized protein LOC115556311 [Gadus morhua]|uniref:uncharacterized protein LOC115540982 n=1 Tax=Gadus morhua TaxID=8049 RepID=UPI0011B3C078|nr:uncharacterized protein LOC115540982 [Gadus morhua]XP_030210793.1 uncharacterized protein LOC115542612 [Gadus morhua]XP_030226956.1 uncharacterized protein LOC115554391 [Gadus morhua]XP_030229359.1 uncharacterized protein LOC115556311 [Gadus morhua]